MQIVINISEESYKNIKEQVDKRDYPDMQIGRAIADGIPLPKGHGELVDRDAINERFDSIYNDAINCSNQPSDKYLLDKLSMCLDTALPIIEADKEK